MALSEILGLKKKKEIPTEFVDEMSVISPPVMVEKRHKVKLVRITNVTGAEGVRKIFTENPSMVLFINIRGFGNGEELKRAVARIKQATPVVVGLDSSWIVAATSDVECFQKGESIL